MEKIMIRTSLFAFLAGALLLASCSTPPDTSIDVSDSVCSNIIDTKCSKCHYKTRICDALGTKSPGKWAKTVKFMIKQGAVLTAEEESKVVVCLSKLPSGSNVVCD